MSLNENLRTRRTQLTALAIAVAAASVVAGGVMYYGHQQGTAQTAPAPTPNMTGVVTAAFDEKVNQSALQQQQAKTSALEQKFDTLNQQVVQNKLNTDQKLAEKDAEIQRLNGELARGASSQQTPPAGQNGTPLPGPISAGQGRPPEYTVSPAPGSPAATGTVNAGQGVGFYPGGSSPRITGGLSTTKFTYDNLKKKPTKLPWVPSGSFSDAILIEGADANASVTGQQNTRPVTLRLQGAIQMPNNKEFSADGCFVVGEIWGDISSERGEVRTKTISCILKNGKHVDMEFDGHVSYQGKGGIKGTPVMRNGKIVGYAGAAGLLSGFGEGIKSAATPSVGLGATAEVGAGDVFRQGLGGGASKAADTLSQYWIKRAEQYHPVIDIGAGNLVTVVFQKGFRLETMEDMEEEKAKEAVQTAGNAVQNAVAPVSTGNQTTSTSSVSNINPDDVLRQASQLRLGDTIN